MLKTTISAENGVLTISPKGRLDTTNAGEFEAEVNEQLNGITNLIFDMKELEYISSAGLRVLLSFHKAVTQTGSMKLINVNEEVGEILDITGFADIFEMG